MKNPEYKPRWDLKGTTCRKGLVTIPEPATRGGEAAGAAGYGVKEYVSGAQRSARAVIHQGYTMYTRMSTNHPGCVLVVSHEHDY